MHHTSRSLISVTIAVQALTAADTIVGPHPRVWMTPELVANIHKKVTSNNPDWAKFRAGMDRLYNLPDNPKASVTWLDSGATMYVALHGLPHEGGHHDTHNATEWAQKVLSWTYSVMNYYAGLNCPGGAITGCSDAKPPWASNERINQSHRLAIVYDWLYPELTARQKQDIYTFLRYSVHQWINDPSSSGAQAWCGMNPAAIGAYNGPGDNACAGAMEITAMTGIATYGDGINPFDNQDYLGNPAPGTNYEFDWALNHPKLGLRATFVPFYNSGYGVGGVQFESSTYSSSDMRYQLNMMLAIESGTNVRFRDLVPQYLTEVPLWIIHSMTPAKDDLNPGVRFPWHYIFQWGDAEWPSRLYYQPEGWRNGMLMSSYMLGSALPGPYIRHYLHHLQPEYPSGAALLGQMYDFLFKDYPDKSETDYEIGGQIPLNYNSNDRCTGKPDGYCGFGWISARSGWGKDATWVVERVGEERIRHGHADSGNFTLYRKGRWLILDPPGYGDPFWVPLFHNVLHYQGVNDHDASNTFVWKGPWSVKASGPGILTYYESPGPDSKCPDCYVYSNADLTQPYRALPDRSTTFGDWRNPISVQRELVYIKPDYIVILDRATFRDLTKSRFQLYFPATAPPTYANGILHSQNANQQVFVTPVYPAATEVSIADMSDVGDYYNQINCNCIRTAKVGTLNSGKNQTFWRGEITTPNQAQNQVMLNVIRGADLRDTAAPITLIQNGEVLGAQIQANDGGWIIAFHNTGAKSPLTLPISYTYASSAGVRHHLIADLPTNLPRNPGRGNVRVTVSSDTVTVTADSDGSYTVSPNGTLYFPGAVTR